MTEGFIDDQLQTTTSTYDSNIFQRATADTLNNALTQTLIPPIAQHNHMMRSWHTAHERMGENESER